MQDSPASPARREQKDRPLVSVPLLHGEDTAADKLSAEGVAGDGCRVNADEVVQELDEALGFIVLRLICTDAQEKGLGKLLDDRKFIDQD